MLQGTGYLRRELVETGTPRGRTVRILYDAELATTHGTSLRTGHGTRTEGVTVQLRISLLGLWESAYGGTSHLLCALVCWTGPFV